jgi:hypothetical protein
MVFVALHTAHTVTSLKSSSPISNCGGWSGGWSGGLELVLMSEFVWGVQVEVSKRECVVDFFVVAIF